MELGISVSDKDGNCVFLTQQEALTLLCQLQAMLRQDVTFPVASQTDVEVDISTEDVPERSAPNHDYMRCDDVACSKCVNEDMKGNYK